MIDGLLIAMWSKDTASIINSTVWSASMTDMDRRVVVKDDC